MTLSLLALLVVCLIAPRPASPQAVVNENLEKQTLYVDIKAGSDSNSGTQSNPFKSIGQAAAVAISNKTGGVGTKVIINPGTYRESVTINGQPGQSSVPITFEAAANGTVVVTGAVEYTGWTPFEGNSHIYTTTWPHRWGLCSSDNGEQPIVLRQEMIFVNGSALTEVLSLSQMMYPGTFFVDEAIQKVYIWPPAGTDLGSSDVEVATNPTLLNIDGGSHHMDGVVIRGLTFEHANPCYNEAAVVVQGTATNILFDNDTFRWNNGQGLALNNPAAYVTIQKSTSNHNGSSGFQGYQANNILYQDVEASYNNWRGAQGGDYYWSAAAAHIFSDHNETMNNFTAKYNQTYSIHWDTDVQNINVNGLYSANNYVGPQFEKSEGPLSVTHGEICYSQSQTAGYAGFIIRNSTNVTLNGLLFYDNNNAGLLITGVRGGIPVTNWQTGQHYNLITSNVTFLQNVVVGTGSQDVFKNGYLGGSDWIQFVTTLKSDHNTWWQSSNNLAFSVPSPTAGTQWNFHSWQAGTAADLHSQWSPPPTNPASSCAELADAPDFWLTVDTDEVNTDKSGTAIFNLATMALGGLGGKLTLVPDGISAIPGVTLAFTPSTVSTSGTSVLTVQTSAKTPSGIHTFTVLANAGNITRTLMLTFRK